VLKNLVITINSFQAVIDYSYFGIPVCLTISDDEDEQANKDKVTPTPMTMAALLIESPRHVKEMCPLLRSKEPSLSEIMQPEELADLSLGNILTTFFPWCSEYFFNYLLTQ